MAEIPALRMDEQNWSAWRANLEWAVNELWVRAHISKMTPNPYDEQANALAKNLLKKPTTTTAVQYELWSDKNTQVAVYSVKTANDHCDTPHCDNDVSHRSGRRNIDIQYHATTHTVSTTREQEAREELKEGMEKMDGGHIEEDPDDQNPPRNPVGMTDGDKHCPNRPTEPPDEKEGERRVDGESTVERVKLKTLNQVDEPGDRRDEEAELRGVEGQREGQNDEDGGH
ncbi:hypothetical protein BDN67DRAFT_1014469 [Paxillus ammoniavirescens]|nr:hypothetical protein BDN67DRAFT_1014469 [Paxillus ammoniavirescens]